MTASVVPQVLLRNLAGIDDRILVRDPRGLSRRRSLAPPDDQVGHGRSLEVRGPFTIIQRFSVDPEEGAAFARTTRDENPIHIQGEVVPGAMTAARALLVPELLLENARIGKAKVRFRAIAYYRRPTAIIYRIEPAGETSLRIDVTVRQECMAVAEGQLLVELSPSPQPSGSTPNQAIEDGLAGTEAGCVRRFLSSLRIDPDVYFRESGPVYPRAYLAALTPGEMVRKYSGDGGILNCLDLEFPIEAVLGATPAPTVELRDGARARKAFRKILARIAEGVRTFCSGFAMVLPRNPGEDSAADRWKPASQ